MHWPDDQTYYAGTIESVDDEKNEHRLKYDDRDKESLVLAKEIWRLYLDRSKSIKLIDSLNKEVLNPKNSVLSSAQNFTESFTKNVLRALCSADDPRFLEPTQDEIKGLLKRGSYTVVRKKMYRVKLWF